MSNIPEGLSKSFDTILAGGDRYAQRETISGIAEQTIPMDEEDFKGLLRTSLLDAYDRAVKSDAPTSSLRYTVEGLGLVAQACLNGRSDYELNYALFGGYDPRYLKVVESGTVSSPIDPEFDNDANYSKPFSSAEVKALNLISAAHMFGRLEAPKPLMLDMANLKLSGQIGNGLMGGVCMVLGQFLDSIEVNRPISAFMIGTMVASVANVKNRVRDISLVNQRHESARLQERQFVEEFDFSHT